MHPNALETAGPSDAICGLLNAHGAGIVVDFIRACPTGTGQLIRHQRVSVAIATIPINVSLSQSPRCFDDMEGTPVTSKGTPR